MKAKKSAVSLRHIQRGEDQFQEWFSEFMQECHTVTRRLSKTRRNTFDFASEVQEIPGQQPSPVPLPIPAVPQPIPPTPAIESIKQDFREQSEGAKSPNRPIGEAGSNFSKLNLLSDDTFRLPKSNSGLSQISGFGSGRTLVGRSGRTSFTHSPMSPHSRLDRYINNMSREELQQHLSRIARIGFELFVGQDIQEAQPKEADSSLIGTMAENMTSVETPEEDMAVSFKVGTVFTVCGDRLEHTNQSISVEELAAYGAAGNNTSDETPGGASPELNIESPSMGSPASQALTGTATNSPSSSAFSLQNTARTTFSGDTADDDDEKHYHRPFKKFSRLVKERDFEGNKVINEYVIVADIGKGSYGKVKLAAHRDDPKDVVAIKIINRSLTKKSRRSSCASPDFEAQIRREIAIMKKLRHRNIVPLHAVIDDVSSDKLYLIMEYVPNGELLQVETDPDKLEEGYLYKPLGEGMAAKVLQQLIDGLRYLHKHQICHRDIKPANILKDMDNQVYLTDFGVSELMESSSVPGDPMSPMSKSVRGTKGTPLFWPPEMFSFNVWDADIDAEMVDLWALGVTTFMMLTGKSPFRGTAFIDIAASVCTDELQIPDHVSEPAQQLLQAMLNKNAAARPRLADLRNHAFLGGPDLRSAAARGSLFAEAPTLDDEARAISIPQEPLIHFDDTQQEPSHPAGSTESREERPTLSLPVISCARPAHCVPLDPSPPGLAAARKSSWISEGQGMSKKSSDLNSQSTQNLTMGSPRPSHDDTDTRRTSECTSMTEPPVSGYCDVEALLASQAALGSHSPHAQGVYRAQFWRSTFGRPVASPPSGTSRAASVSLPPIAAAGASPSPPAAYQVPFRRSGSMM
jgi:[calcium/calmodulin-dependent protein kinase] kinase